MILTEILEEIEGHNIELTVNEADKSGALKKDEVIILELGTFFKRLSPSELYEIGGWLQEQAKDIAKRHALYCAGDFEVRIPLETEPQKNALIHFLRRALPLQSQQKIFKIDKVSDLVVSMDFGFFKKDFEAAIESAERTVLRHSTK